MKFTGEQAQNILGWLIQEGKLSAAFVEKALTRREAAVRDLRSRLAALEGREVAKVKRAVAKRRTKAKKPMSPARRASLKLHGRYLGITRRLPATAKAKVKAIRAKHGVRKAIATAKRLGKKG